MSNVIKSTLEVSRYFLKIFGNYYFQNEKNSFKYTKTEQIKR